MKMKICGMKYQANISEVAKLQPDYLGFIFYKKSSRFFEGIIPQLPKSIKKVGIFVNASIEEIKEKVNQYNLDLIQLHGNESPMFCKELNDFLARTVTSSGAKSVTSSGVEKRDPNKIEIIKVFSIKDAFDFSVLAPYRDVCDYFLFDTKGKLPGGNGYAFNWKVLKDYPSTKPYFLSGGIGLDEIENIKEFLQRGESEYCHAIDVNSKFEIEPGMKDFEKLKSFKTKLNNTNTNLKT